MNSKRFLDIVGAIIAMIVFSPLLLICYVAVWVCDKQPVIFSQERVGMGGKSFRIYKFRTMAVSDSELAEPKLTKNDDDPRLTKVGKFLRVHHLDELPQLWNVLKGDMSFVGPRPERKFFIDKIMELDPRYALLYQIRPGVTSYATLYNGYTDTMDKMLRRLEYDLEYLEHQSILFDLQILWLTFVKIICGKKF